MKSKVFLSLVVALLLSVGVFAAGGRTAEAVESISSGNEYIDAFVNTALSYEGQSGLKVLNLKSGAYCGYFVGFVGQKAGIAELYLPKADDLWSASYVDTKGYSYGATTTYFYSDMGSSIKNGVLSSLDKYDIKKGDIVTFRNVVTKKSDKSVYKTFKFAHVGIVYDIDDDYIYVIHGNWGGDKIRTDRFSRAKDARIRYSDYTVTDADGNTIQLRRNYYLASFTSLNFPDEKADGLQFVNILYPSTLKSGDEYNAYGAITSDFNITDVTVQITSDSTGEYVSSPVTVHPNATIYNLSSINSKIYFSKCTSSNGSSFTYTVTASDASGATLTMDMPITPGDKTAYSYASKTYEETNYDFSGISYVNSCMNNKTGKSYALFSGSVSWKVANAYARSLGTGWKLATIDDYSTDYVSDYAAVKKLVGNFGYACWLGARNTSSGWKWVDGGELSTTLSYWASGQPSGTHENGDAENYLGIYGPSDTTKEAEAYKFNDFRSESSTVKGFIAEYTPQIVPSDGSIILSTGNTGNYYIPDEKYRQSITSGYSIIPLTVKCKIGTSADGKWYLTGAYPGYNSGETATYYSWVKASDFREIVSVDAVDTTTSSSTVFNPDFEIVVNNSTSYTVSGSITVYIEDAAGSVAEYTKSGISSSATVSLSDMQHVSGTMLHTGDHYVTVKVSLDSGSGYTLINRRKLGGVQTSSAKLIAAVTNTTDGHVFAAYEGTFTWEAAKAFAEGLGDGWRLAVIDSFGNDESGDYGCVMSVVKKLNKACWLGATNLDGTWKWLDGTSVPMNTGYWDSGEPSGGSEHYLGIYANDTQTSYSTTGKWNDFSNSSSTPKGLVAEYVPSQPTVQPLSVTLSGKTEIEEGESLSFDYTVTGGVEPYEIEFEIYTFEDGEHNTVRRTGGLSAASGSVELTIDEYIACELRACVTVTDAAGNMGSDGYWMTMTEKPGEMTVAWSIDKTEVAVGDAVKLSYNISDGVQPYRAAARILVNTDSGSFYVDSVDCIWNNDHNGYFTLRVTEQCAQASSMSVVFEVEDEGTGSFSGTSELTIARNIITLPAALTSVGERAFYGNTTVTRVVIPNGVTTIGSEAFSRCSRLNYAIVPQSVTVIADNAFSGVSSAFIARVVKGSYADSYFTAKGITVEYVSTWSDWTEWTDEEIEYPGREGLDWEMQSVIRESYTYKTVYHYNHYAYIGKNGNQWHGPVDMSSSSNYVSDGKWEYKDSDTALSKAGTVTYQGITYTYYGTDYWYLVNTTQEIDTTVYTTYYRYRVNIQ